jgi:hypothetical protein
MDGETADPTEEDNNVDDELADMQEEEIQRKVEEMRSWASLLHELADQIDYNAAYADQRVYDLIAHTIAPSIQLRNKVREKENATNSSQGTNLTTWSAAFAGIMTWRTRPLDRIRQSLNSWRTRE